MYMGLMGWLTEVNKFRKNFLKLVFAVNTLKNMRKTNFC